MIDFLCSIIIAFSFFTILPSPKMKWTDKRLKAIPLILPIIGLVGGLILYLLFNIIIGIEISSYFKSVIIVLIPLIYTGGLHIDGLMDSTDAFFSRRPKEEKLKIMKDPNIGPFAVLFILFFFLIKIAIFNELIINDFNYLFLIFVPIFSRLTAGISLYSFKPAKETGILLLFHRKSKVGMISLLLILLISSILIYLMIGIFALLLPLISLITLLIFYYHTRKLYSGITGDLTGAYIEITEFLMILSILFL